MPAEQSEDFGGVKNSFEAGDTMKNEHKESSDGVIKTENVINNSKHSENDKTALKDDSSTSNHVEFIQTDNFNLIDDDDESDIPSLEDIKEEFESKDKPLKSFRIGDETPRLTDEDGWIDILGNGDLKKRVIKSGEGLKSRPERGNWITLNMKGKLNDTVVEEASNLKIILGDSDVIQGLDLAIALMEKGEVAEITVPSRLGYGKQGKLPDVPPNADLHYEVELLSVEEAEEECKLPLSERLRIGGEKREKGNFWYSRGDYSSAIHCYRRALDFLDDTNQNFINPPEELQQLLDARLIVYNNMAAAQLKVEAYDAALKSVEFVLKVQPKNVKALFRKGKILAAKGKINDAVEQMKKALKIEPETKVIHQELSKLMNKKKNEEKAEKAMYKRMFGQDKPKPKSSSSKFYAWSLIIGSLVAVVAGIAVYRIHSAG